MSIEIRSSFLQFTTPNKAKEIKAKVISVVNKEVTIQLTKELSITVTHEKQDIIPLKTLSLLGDITFDEKGKFVAFKPSKKAIVSAPKSSGGSGSTQQLVNRF
jgi:hypothetical protein